MNSKAEAPEPHPPEGPEVAVARERAAWYRDGVLLTTLPAVIAADQLTKYLIKANFQIGESWPTEGIARLTYGTNTGTAFGLFPNQTVILIIASIIAIGFLIYFYRTHAMPRPLLRFAIGLQLGGALGNLIDRVRSGAVVDFIDLGWWPIFNLADSSIVVGLAILFGILLFAGRELPPAADSSSDLPGDVGGGHR